MTLPRLVQATHIADRLNELAAIVKTRSRASLTDANHILETIAMRFFNALYGWNLINLNALEANYPAVDLGDRERRISIQVTNAEGSEKITHTAAKAIEHGLGKDFDRLIIFFLLPKKPTFPKKFVQPPKGPKIETQDIADLLRQMQEMKDLEVLAKAAKVLDEEMGKIPQAIRGPGYDISRILKYAPDQLIGREGELKLLNDAWEKTQTQAPMRPHVLTFVALGGEGKTALVTKWAAELAAKDWTGCDAALAWSFYSQGTREQMAASSDLFLKEALNFFGDDDDKAFAASKAGAFEKGQRLARVVGRRHSLLILDGLEPLQYAPTAPTPGELKDQGLAALLKGLATASRGLCVVTTRYSLPDLKAFRQTTAPEVELLRLSGDAGVHLLRTLGVHGTAQEFAKLVEDVKGHALTLTLLGSYLCDAHGGDIRKRDLVKLEEADAEEQGGHAFRVMEAYEHAFEREGDKGKRALAILRLLGLFDRPMTADCFGALLQPPTISGLTDPLIGITEAQRNIAIKRLGDAKLITVNRGETALGPSSFTLPTSIDAHPLLREYFARQLCAKQPDAWRAAHQRLYEHLCKHKEGDKPTLEDLQPLYQAVAHGCQAGLQQEACDEVYYSRIRRGKEDYSSKQLGAHGSNLGAIACFFEQPWGRVSPALRDADQAWTIHGAAFSLRALGRLAEALELMRAELKMRIKQESWHNAAITASNLSELELTLGEVARAIQDAEQCVTYADHSGDAFQRMGNRTAHADALHQTGRRAEAEKLFREAEQMQKEMQPHLPLLYSVQGFQYCDLLLATTERAAWRTFLGLETQDLQFETLKAVSQRAGQTLKWASDVGASVLSLALDHLTLGRAALYEAILTNSEARDAKSEIDGAAAGLRRAGTTHHIPRALLTRAWLRYLEGSRTGPESAQADLDEAWEIAERGPMRLHMADIHLYRARLFLHEAHYPWESPAADLNAAEKLINECGYGRRREELEDAKAALGLGRA